jgi:proteasome lid subunit RPN8/RPN11
MNRPGRFLLRVPAGLYREVLEHAAAELPAECCGLLAGTISQDGSVGLVTHRFALVNELASPTEFLSEPRSMFAAMKAMRAANVEVLAVYHSHPTGAPIPSRRDQERNYSEGVVNLIVGLATGVPEVRAWWLSADSYLEAQLEMIQPETPVGVEPT